MKIQNVIESKFDPGNMDYVKREVPVKNSATAKLPNSFVNQSLDPVVYRNGNSVNDQIGLDFSGHDYTDDSSAKDGTPTKKKKKKAP